MTFTWLTQGSFLFESNGVRILVDPYMSDIVFEREGLKRLVDYPLTFDELKPDLLICTHDHIDHLDPETVTKIGKMYPDCVFAGPASCVNHFRKLNIAEEKIQLLRQEQDFLFRGFTLTAVPAFHSDPDAVGIVLEADGKRVYLSGDSLYDVALVNEVTKGCDMALVCINGRLGNMSWQEAVRVVTQLEAETALPMHYGLFAENTEDPQPFIDACLGNNIKSYAMNIGEKVCL